MIPYPRNNFCKILILIAFSSLLLFFWRTKTIQKRQNPALKCSDRVLTSETKQRGNFYVLSNFIKASRHFPCDKSITFATPADYSFLDNLETLVRNWKGPVSVALYVPGYDFKNSLYVIGYMRKCQSPLIKELVSFHLFFEMENIPEQILPVNEEEDIDCDKNFEDYLVPSNETYRSMNELVFPINTARNIAKEESQTHFVFVCDIELSPSPNFIQKFLEMTETNYSADVRQVFVLPVFEVKENIPANKSELQRMYKAKSAQIFHKTLCMACHRIPQFDNWIKMNETKSLGIFTKTKRVKKVKNWEPFFVGSRDIPNFDERFSWEGQDNKMVQNYLMCVLDYDYVVLDNAFLTHKPGYKKIKVQWKKFQKFIGRTKQLIKNRIRPEYLILYGNSTQCKL